MRIEAIVIGAVGGLCVISLTVIECLALNKGIDGQLMVGTVGGVSAILGVVGSYIYKLVKERKDAKKTSLPPGPAGSDLNHVP